MGKLTTTDMRISKLISSLRNIDGADTDGDTILESTSTGTLLKDNPAACRVVFDEMKDIILEECDLLSHIVRFEIIEKNDRIHGSYSHKDSRIRVVIEGRSNMSIVNTMAHELRHAFQHYNGFLLLSHMQKESHSKVVEDYMYSLEDFDATEEHVRNVLYTTSWHEVDARRYARWFTRGGVGEFKETGDFYINEENINKKLIAQLLTMGEVGRFDD